MEFVYFIRDNFKMCNPGGNHKIVVQPGITGVHRGITGKSGRITRKPGRIT
jgi:hypothetical protein